MISTSGIRGTGYMKCMHGHPTLCWNTLMLHMHIHSIPYSSDIARQVLHVYCDSRAEASKKTPCPCVLDENTIYL